MASVRMPTLPDMRYLTISHTVYFSLEAVRHEWFDFVAFDAI